MRAGRAVMATDAFISLDNVLGLPNPRQRSGGA